MLRSPLKVRKVDGPVAAFRARCVRAIVGVFVYNLAIAHAFP